MAKTERVGGGLAFAVNVSDTAVEVYYYEVAIGHPFASSEVESGCFTVGYASFWFHYLFILSFLLLVQAMLCPRNIHYLFADFCHQFCTLPICRIHCGTSRNWRKRFIISRDLLVGLRRH